MKKAIKFLGGKSPSEKKFDICVEPNELRSKWWGQKFGHTYLQQKYHPANIYTINRLEAQSHNNTEKPRYKK